MQGEGPILFKTQEGEWKTATCGECLYHHLGNYVDIEWDIKSAHMRIQKSMHHQASYRRQGHVEILERVHYQHSVQCPLLKPEIQKNPEKTLKPCSCVMLYKEEEKQFLVTQRSSSLSFPNAWVLPGGHLEPGEGLFEGGMRECEEEVGLPRAAEGNLSITDRHVMIWESINDVDKKARSGALIVFFLAYCKHFEAKIDPREVQAFKWRKIAQTQDEHLYQPEKQEGYARGHIAFLNVLRQENPHL